MMLYVNNLILRTVEINDIEEVARMWEYPKGSISKKEARSVIDYMQNNHMKNRLGYIYHLCFAVFEKDKHKIIGWCGLDGETIGRLHIFYQIDKDYRNKSYATQCASRLLSYAFDETHVPFVNGGCDKDNIASYKVMVKIGMNENGFNENGDPLLYIDEAGYRKIVQGGE
jgi:RimJ/RimL family protein N-acetyltransferase